MARRMTSYNINNILMDYRTAASSPTPDETQYEESIFRRALVHELKRTRVSERPFMLMLVSLSDTSAGNGRTPLSRVLSSLAASIRDTDVLGWYKSGSVLGVIYTEINSSGSPAVSSIMERVHQCLASGLEPGELKKVNISVYLFPMKQELPDLNTEMEQFFPELKHHGAVMDESVLPEETWYH